MLAMHVLAHHDRVHDRKDFAARVVVALDLLEVWKEPRDLWRAVEVEFGNIEREQRIELARGEHLLQRLPCGQKVKPDRLRQVERNEWGFHKRIEPAHEPVHVLRLDAVVMLEESPPQAQ